MKPSFCHLTAFLALGYIGALFLTGIIMAPTDKLAALDFFSDDNHASAIKKEMKLLKGKTERHSSERVKIFEDINRIQDYIHGRMAHLEAGSDKIKNFRKQLDGNEQMLETRMKATGKEQKVLDAVKAEFFMRRLGESYDEMVEILEKLRLLPNNQQMALPWLKTGKEVLPDKHEVIKKWRRISPEKRKAILSFFKQPEILIVPEGNVGKMMELFNSENNAEEKDICEKDFNVEYTCEEQNAKRVLFDSLAARRREGFSVLIGDAAAEVADFWDDEDEEQNLETRFNGRVKEYQRFGMMSGSVPVYLLMMQRRAVNLKKLVDERVKKIIPFIGADAQRSVITRQLEQKDIKGIDQNKRVVFYRQGQDYLVGHYSAWDFGIDITTENGKEHLERAVYRPVYRIM